jgi:TonB dependent receptor.
VDRAPDQHHRHPAWNLSLTHFLRYRAGYRDIGKTGEQVEVDGVIADVYDRRDFSATFNWDVRISWEKALAGQQAAFVNLDIFNLLDRVNVTSLGAQDIPQYETGRSFWVELGYRF